MIVGIVSMNTPSLHVCLVVTYYLKSVQEQFVHQCQSFAGQRTNFSYDCNCSLFVFPHGLYLAKNMFFIMVKSLK